MFKSVATHRMQQILCSLIRRIDVDRIIAITADVHHARPEQASSEEDATSPQVSNEDNVRSETVNKSYHLRHLLTAAGLAASFVRLERLEDYDSHWKLVCDTQRHQVKTYIHNDL